MAITDAWTAITTAQTDANSPLNETLMEALRSEDRRVQVWAPGKPEQAREAARSQKTW